MDPHPASLPPQQEKVITGVSAGKTRKQIALDMGISVSTVNFYLMIIRGRLGARNISEAVAKYERLKQDTKPIEYPPH